MERDGEMERWRDGGREEGGQMTMEGGGGSGVQIQAGQGCHLACHKGDQLPISDSGH